MIPMLLYNSETWGEISNKTWKILNNIFNDFYRCLFRIGTGCPIIGFYWHCGDFFVENRVHQRKLNFVHHLANLEEGLAKEVYEIQEKGESGIVAEVKEHMINMNVDSPRGYSK